MDTSKLKKFAQYARRYLMEQVAAKMKFVLVPDGQARRENPKAVEDLERQIRATSQEQVIEKVAYIWFNRFCAIRFMDANRYTRIGILSPAEGQFQPEILAEAKMGHIDEELMPDVVRQKVFNLLNGSIPSRDPQAEAYHLLVVAACNYYNKTMPFMFEKIADYTELLIPDDLLSGNSILAYTREALTPDICQDVEVIGWLYQFYISEKKDEVFDGLKKNKKITPENIPAATQLFTPHWIVRYLVENSLGRLWMLNRPNSRLIDQMDYYIKPETPETDFLRISKPEEIKLCDPASGSGHMLTYSYDLLYAIYEEEGYDSNDIPRLILENNLFGIEIDERAGELAAFALTMKAASGNPRDEKSNHRRFFRNPIQPNICVLQNVLFEDGELKNYMDAVGRDLFTVNLQTMLHQFREADNFGSLIRPEYADAASVLRKVEEKNLTSDLFLQNTHERVLLALKQADYLSTKYHVVVANPPYMGGKGMNDRLKVFAQNNYAGTKSDLFGMFIERNIDLTINNGMVAMITMQSWMFLSSFESLRSIIFRQDTILSMAHLGARAFDSIGGEVVSTTAFVLENAKHPKYKGGYLRLVDGISEAEKEQAIFEAIRNPNCGWFFRASTNDFNKIPGSPVAYWVSERVRDIFSVEDQISEHIDAKQGLGTGADAKFFRYFWEVDFCKMAIGFNSAMDVWKEQNLKWVPLNKGGSLRKWSGNREYVISFDKKSRDILKDLGNHLPSEDRYFKPFISWSDITSATNSFRYYDKGFLFSNTGHCAFPDSYEKKSVILAYCNNRFVDKMTKILNPTIHFHVGYFNLLPNPSRLYSQNKKISDLVQYLIDYARKDWDSYETSWDFTRLPLLESDERLQTLPATYQKLRSYWREMTLEMQQREEENNRIFIDAYGLHDELTPKVPLNEISLTCNPYHRYQNAKTEEERETALLADTLREFISYAVGCMFGRYSLDKPGLILANLGETVEDYLARVPDPTFAPDEDNVIPILDEGWFIDDITERFRKFLKVTFGEAHYKENMQFIVEALNVKKKKDYTVRDYFLTEFYNDHLKRYKKRPIYWLFSSPKGSFNALIYMHRYRPDTASVVLNDYLREFRTKLSARKEHLEQVSISGSASPKEKTQALKDLEKLRKIIDELDEYERETLYPLATKQIPIDLDGGVKVNYLKFGDALKKIPGLDAGEE